MNHSWRSGVTVLLVCGRLTVATPLEVRYLYALTLPLAVAVADGTLRLWAHGPAARLAALGLLGGQAWIAGLGLVEAVLSRYR